jgi:predicted metal-dependent hydrolase
MTWPPLYTVKTHPRARSVKLKASLKKGLEIITPPRFNRNNIQDILEKNKSWIQKQLLKIQERLEHVKKDELPLEISLTAIQQQFSIQYIASDNKKLQLLLRPQQQEMVVIGNIQNKSLCKKLLTQWVKTQAEKWLTPIFQTISVETNLPYSKVSFRDQETRWGSCSSNKNINLNYKLIFLPFHVVRNIMIHELCHTVHLNHSQRFWKLVASFDPDWRKHAKEIRHPEIWIPFWYE